MKIGILGTGTVARTLGSAWAETGHEVLLGTRSPKKNGALKYGTMEEAASFGEVILVALNPWTEIEGALRPLAEELRGKTIVDVSNNIEFGKMPPSLAFTDRTMGEALQLWLPASNVVKTLNITPAAMMVRPADSGIVPAIGWVSGNNDTAKQQVVTLLNDLGWMRVIDLGDIHQSVLQESIGLTLSIIVTGITMQQN